MLKLRKANLYYPKSMSRGGYNKPKTATEMFRESIQPYDNLYEFYKVSKDADIIIHCKDKWGREITFVTGVFANELNDKLLINK